MQFLNFTLNALITIGSLIVLFFAFAKNNNLGRLSVFVIFGSLLLQQFIGVLATVDFLDFTDIILSQITSFVIYGEIALLAILFISKMKQASNKTFRISLIGLIILKVILILGVI